MFPLTNKHADMHTDTYVHTGHRTSHHAALAVDIPVKVVLVMGGGLHMGDLLSWGETNTH